MDVVQRLRDICEPLPDAYEEEAWVGIRFRVRNRTFVHCCAIDEGRPPAGPPRGGGAPVTDRGRETVTETPLVCGARAQAASVLDHLRKHPGQFIQVITR